MISFTLGDTILYIAPWKTTKNMQHTSADDTTFYIVLSIQIGLPASPWKPVLYLFFMKTSIQYTSLNPTD